MASALIVFNDPSQLGQLHMVLGQFGQQTWPYREAVLINATGAPFDSNTDRVRVFNLKARYLGELKNLALYNALGEWCFPWPLDCKYSPGYMEFHMIRRSRALPTVVRNPTGYVLKDGRYCDLDAEAAPFVSFFRFTPHTYDQDGSDWNFVQKFPELNLAEAPAGSATRFFTDYGD